LPALGSVVESAQIQSGQVTQDQSAGSSAPSNQGASTTSAGQMAASTTTTQNPQSPQPLSTPDTDLNAPGSQTTPAAAITTPPAAGTTTTTTTTVKPKPKPAPKESLWTKFLKLFKPKVKTKK